MKNAVRTVGRLARMGLLLVAGTCVAQVGIWPVATLQPLGADVEVTDLAAVALAGDVAVTAYVPSATIGYRVFARKRLADGWGEAQLLVQGEPGEGEGLALDADANRIAVGLPKAATRGRVDVFVRNGEAWLLEQSLSDPPDSSAVWPVSAENFGRHVSLRNSLLVISSAQSPLASRFDVYRHDAANSWIPANYSYSNPMYGSMIGKTDGVRVATCSNVNCSVKSIDSGGQWVSEGTVAGAGNFGIAGNWLFSQGTGQLQAFFRSGNSWVLRQQFGVSAGFSVSNGRMIMRPSGSPLASLQIHELDDSGSWALAAEIDGGGAGADSKRLAIGEGLAIAASQGFAKTEDDWLTSGAVQGVVDTTTQEFGAAVALASGSAWIGSPGYLSYFKSGAVWMQSLSGTLPSQVATRDGPIAPAQNIGFGRTVATDGTRVVVASQPSSTLPLQIAVYAAGTISPRVAHLALPQTAASVWKVDAAIDGVTLAVVRSFDGLASDLSIFRDDGNGFQKTQTIVLPENSAYSGYGQNVEIAGDWLLAGRMQYRLTPGVGFVQIGDVSYPAGQAVDFSRMAKHGNHLVVPSAFLTGGDPVARLFRMDPGIGWLYSGDLNEGSAPGAFCYWPAISDVAIVCMQPSSNLMHVAVPDSSASNWAIAYSAALPGITPAGGPSSQTALAIEGSNVLVGSRAKPQVFLLSVSEAIFSAAFDAQ